LARVGGTAALLVGVLSVSGALTYLFLPADQRVGIEGDRLLPSFARDPILLQALLWQLALIAVLGIAVVSALSRRVRAANEGWVTWTSILAIAGLALTAAGHLLTLSRLPKIADAFVAGDPSTKAALLPIWRSTLDPQALLGYGAVGVWILVASLLALRTRALPQALAGFGVAVAILHWLIPAGLATSNQGVLGVVIAAFAVASATWYVWLGTALRRAA
jgi:Domain of unknown function (DUF4386)